MIKEEVVKVVSTFKEWLTRKPKAKVVPEDTPTNDSKTKKRKLPRGIRDYPTYHYLSCHRCHAITCTLHKLETDKYICSSCMGVRN